ncbi:hypothetical protein [Cellulomonas sp. ATA003]|uniref:hypothetical protein n=1 Tax=Cellulomonas sp. ATA003 TaxID=3073064 RepID=UPI002872C116|nr:hypothetical protein [Cellulomonas sp. ATA003]WNB86463.1 hypothetical protein REH70_04280 [Cellulomonas sp. ATA003]
MFKVENADFIADKLAAELLPDQEYREVAKNAEEAIRRRLEATGAAGGGRIEFDVDWALHAQSGATWFLCCADNGDGMDRYTLERYMTTLAVEGAGANQSLQGNQGMGLKISGPTRHKEGLLIRSLRDGQGSMIQIGWDKRTRQYGAIPLGLNEQIVVPTPIEFFPDFIRTTGSGTVVTFLGNEPEETTLVPLGRPKSWLFKYLNRRFYRLDDHALETLVRQPAGDPEGWPHSSTEAAAMASWNFARVQGTGSVWDAAAGRDGGHHGTQTVAGDASAGIPRRRSTGGCSPLARAMTCRLAQRVAAALRRCTRTSSTTGGQGIRQTRTSRAWGSCSAKLASRSSSSRSVPRPHPTSRAHTCSWAVARYSRPTPGSCGRSSSGPPCRLRSVS